MAQRVRWRPTLTEAQSNDLFMLMLADDTEDAPWLTMGDVQFWSASGLAHSLRQYARDQSLGWYVASMLPIEYRWPTTAAKKVLSPDIFVAFVATRWRESFDATTEGFPPFVVEVVSPTSRRRDRREKRLAYDLLGVQEYVLFTPRRSGDGVTGEVAGYHRDAAGRFVDWPPDAQGRLWSRQLNLFLVARGADLQAQTADGSWLPTLEQAEAAQRAAEAAYQQAEAEIARLRAALERYQRDEPSA
jgi:Uma2 family endonuclease